MQYQHSVYQKHSMWETGLIIAAAAPQYFMFILLWLYYSLLRATLCGNLSFFFPINSKYFLSLVFGFCLLSMYLLFKEHQTLYQLCKPPLNTLKHIFYWSDVPNDVLLRTLWLTPIETVHNLDLLNHKHCCLLKISLHHHLKDLSLLSLLLETGMWEH